MTVSASAWNKFVARLARINDEAARKMGEYIQRVGYGDTQALIDYAYALATKYGEASAALAAEWYDAIAALMGQVVPPAMPAPTATYDEVAGTVIGVVEGSQNPEMLSSAVARLVKQAGEDTTLWNAQRDRALVAWIPNGDTCAFCIALASNGWQFASTRMLRNGHAAHVHSNCDCTHAVTWDPFDSRYASYDEDMYEDMYKNAPLNKWNTPDGKPPAGHAGSEKPTARNRVNAMRREFYAENKDRINAQKRDAYAKRIELNSSAAEETDV